MTPARLVPSIYIWFHGNKSLPIPLEVNFYPTELHKSRLYQVVCALKLGFFVSVSFSFTDVGRNILKDTWLNGNLPSLLESKLASTFSFFGMKSIGGQIGPLLWNRPPPTKKNLMSIFWGAFLRSGDRFF